MDRVLLTQPAEFSLIWNHMKHAGVLHQFPHQVRNWSAARLLCTFTLNFFAA